MTMKSLRTWATASISPATVLLVLGLYLGSSPCAAEVVVENYETGEKKVEYNVKNGKRNGAYSEYYIGGQLRVKAVYRNDKLSGNYIAYHGNGVPKVRVGYKNGLRHGKYEEFDSEARAVVAGEYQRGVLHGPYVTYRAGKREPASEFERGELVKFRGQRVHPHTKKELAVAMGKIRDQEPSFEGATAEQRAALARLNTYRLLSRLPADVKLDEARCQVAADEANLQAEQGEQEVEANYPQNQAVRIPANVTNPNASVAIDAFMANNEERFAHTVLLRRAILNPKMTQVGIAAAGHYGAMSKDDASRTKVASWKYIAHPGPGYTPVDYFSADRPWSVMINGKSYRSILADKGIVVRPINENLTFGKPLELEYKTEVLASDDDPLAGDDPYLIFYPRDVEVAPGKRYWVEITGFMGPDRKLAPIKFLVDFIEPVDLSDTKTKRRRSRRPRR
ncbi:MAG: hypothetical protein DWQ31_20885 [Planctomycetota bacterium]|nr:MAG: hypothetical protein DWQ31_20885 [Planctomycetota bacterium]REJ88459.1 MAG: hypothetical protein DWQ35_19855 [Planctomycetota bacterium]REK22344.1 MAG: hypothetical protein DWQ42_17550 [Planctomycetota bacterium]